VGDKEIDYQRIRQIVREELARHAMETERIAAARQIDERIEKLTKGLSDEATERSAGNFHFAKGKE
jgi:hypothetical protein